MDTSVTITRARHAWPEGKGFLLHRPRGIKEWTFLHFYGSVSILVRGQVVTAPAGACIFYAPDTPQWFQSPGQLVHDWMHMTGPVAEGLRGVGLEPDTLYLPTGGRFITPILREIELELLTRPEGEEALAELKFRELLIKLARAVREEGPEEPLRPEIKTQLRQIRSYMFANLDRSWTVRQMAEWACISPSRFHTVYRAAFGISPVDDVIHARIDTAKNRLCSSDETVACLASSLGYRNVTHFCRQFRQITGMTPTEFRKAQEGRV